jgi:uncharacterized membrane protein YhaH (DUF805 family)
MSQHVEQQGSAPLDWPQYGIGPVAAVKRGFAKYAVFDGRASRSEFWWWYAFYVVGVSLLAILGGTIGAATAPAGSDSFGVAGIVFFVLAGVFFLGIIVPTLAVGARRLHDGGFSALFLLLLLASSFGGGIVLLVLWVLPTSPKAVRFGPPGLPADNAYPYGSGYPDAQGYGAPPGYGGQPGYGAPQEYGGQPGYGAPQEYGGQPGYGAPQEYGGQPDPQTGDRSRDVPPSA